MILFIHDLLQTIFPSSWIGWLQSLILNSGSWITDSVSTFLALRILACPSAGFGVLLKYIFDYSILAFPFLVLSILVPVIPFFNNASLWVTFTLGFSLE